MFFSQGKNGERLAVILSSPDLNEPQPKGVIGISDGCGITQATVIKKVLNEWNVFEAVDSVSFDTTANNTGCINGAVSIIERWRGKSLLWLACRYHVIEHRTKEIEKVAGKVVNGPTDNTFKILHDNWDKMFVKGINYDNMNKFDLKTVERL